MKRKPWLFRVDEKFLNEFIYAKESDIIEFLNIDVQLKMPIRPTDYYDILPHYHFTVEYVDVNHDNCETFPIAWAEVVVLDFKAINEYDLQEICDAESEELLDAYNAIFDRDEYLKEPLDEYGPSPVCYLAEFIVEEKFESVRRDILNWIVKYLSNFSPILVTLPVPSYLTSQDNCHYIERDFDDIKTNLLRRFFTNQRFLPLRDTDFMYHLLEYSFEEESC